MEQEWKERAAKMSASNLKAIEGPLAELDAHLTLRSTISGFEITDIDRHVWTVLRGNRVAHSYIKQGLMTNLSRWFQYIEASEPQLAAQNVHQKPAEKPIDKKTSTRRTDIITRFPPEPSGYLHIGHAKAALINDQFAHETHNGTLILRFDDTNPLKEKQEFEDAIIEDLALLGVTPDKTSHTSDYFKELYDFCVQLISQGDAYADDTAQELMRSQRMDGIASARRDTDPKESLERFAEMQSGSEEGKKWFIRAKISVDAPNKALRDPVIYRCSPQAHHRTGTTWKVYPTYDFCCPIVDSIEKVTHAFRTTEYNDRDAQYQWFLKVLKLQKVKNSNFSRLSFVKTVLSKRKLTKLVAAGVVWGWDDPRMPTVRGVRRRGMTVAALREYIATQGDSKNIVLLSWDSFWTANKKVIDPQAARYTAVDSGNECKVTVNGTPEEPYFKALDKSPRQNQGALGTKQVFFSRSVIIDQADARTFAEGEEITLMNWGNAFVKNIQHNASGDGVSAITLDLHLEGDVKTTKKKVSWLSVDQALVPVDLVDFGYLITKDKLDDEDKLEDFLTPQTEFRTTAIADCNVKDLKKGDIIQFDRKGYFIVDQPYIAGKQKAIFFQIPTGKGK